MLGSMGCRTVASFFLFAATCALACAKGQASEADCAAYVSQFVALAGVGQGPEDAQQSKQIAEQMREELQQRCLTQGTAREVECVRKAASLAEFQACGTVSPD
jgi:small lipoprotein (TIGR04454 family)